MIASAIGRRDVIPAGPSVDSILSAAERACPAQGAVVVHSAGGQCEHSCSGADRVSWVEAGPLEVGRSWSIVTIAAAPWFRQCDPTRPPSPISMSGWTAVSAIRHALTVGLSQRKHVGATVISLKCRADVDGFGIARRTDDSSQGARKGLMLHPTTMVTSVWGLTSPGSENAAQRTRRRFTKVVVPHHRGGGI